jgi:RNA polymerase sigma-70 factor (ECF subfamily)
MNGTGTASAWTPLQKSKSGGGEIETKLNDYIDQNLIVRQQELRLIERAQLGDRAAFTALMEAYRDRVLRLALYRIGNSEDAHDAVQETFVRVYRALNRFDRKRSFAPWVYRIAHNVIIDHFRLKKNRIQPVEPNPEQPFEDGPDRKAVNPEQAVISEEVRDQVWKAIQSLPENYRCVVVFRFLDDLSYAEIAEALELTEANVMMRMSRARRMLSDRLAPLQGR